MSYGPEAFRSSDTFIFNGVEMPCISDATYAELWEKAKGNYTNYARQFLGSTLSFAKSQAFEYQCTSEVGKEGAGRISTAIGLGTIKHPELAVAANAWYTSVPATLPTTTAENDMLDSYTDLNQKFSAQKDGSNIFVDVITKGYVEEGMTNAATAAETVAGKMNGKQYITLENDAWLRAQDFFAAMIG